jgi:DNA-directed RNA polymerase specialized sigma24 family protein
LEEEISQPMSDEEAAEVEAELEDTCLPPYEGEGLPPELRAVPRAELVSAMRVVRAFVIKKTKSKLLADDFVPNVFVKITRTRRWNPAKGPFSRHYMLCMKSELSNYWKSKAPEKEAEAHEGFGREELPTKTPSVEDDIIREETEAEVAAARQAKAARELLLLRARIAGHELMPGVLAALEHGTEERAAIARELRVPAQKVYRALDLMRHHLKKIRETEGEEKK